MLVEIGVALLSGFLGAIVKDFVARPLREYRQIRKKIAKDMIKYGNLITSPGDGTKDKMDEAAYELRDDAAELRAVMEDIPIYSFWSLIGVPSKSTLEEVEDLLIRLSNSIHSGTTSRNDQDRNKIRRLLQISS